MFFKIFYFDPDPELSEKSDPDPEIIISDPSHCLAEFMPDPDPNKYEKPDADPNKSVRSHNTATH